MNKVRKLDLRGYKFIKRNDVYIVMQTATSKLGGSGDIKSRWFVLNTRTKESEVMFTKDIRRKKAI